MIRRKGECGFRQALASVALTTALSSVGCGTAPTASAANAPPQSPPAVRSEGARQVAPSPPSQSASRAHGTGTIAPSEHAPGDNSAFDVAPFAPHGFPRTPGTTPTVVLDEGSPNPPIPMAAGSSVRLAFRGDIYLAQAAAFFARLDDADAAVTLEHPDAALNFVVRLRDERDFQAWLDEPVPGKVRVIQRADGFEVQTNLGKIPGGDPNGPTVPVRGGKFDVARLANALAKAKERFPDAPDYCLVPSFGMELNAVVRAMAANFPRDGTPLFKETCLVYPRPRPK